MRSVGSVAFHLGTKKAKTYGIIIGVLASLMVVGAILAAVTVSNLLSFGPFQLEQYLGDAVSLSEVDGLPASISIEKEERIKFTIQANKSVPNATLWLRLSADASLPDPTIAQVEYEHPGASRVPVTLTTETDGTLNGLLRSGWDIPAGFSDEGRLRITFLPNAPTTATYSIDIWAEYEDTEAGPPSASASSSTSITLGDNFFSPDLVNISVGDTVTWNWTGKHHTTTGTGSESWDSGINTSGSFSRTFNTAGSFTYKCTLHSEMVGTIIVQ